jgi:hypothetical protein
VANSRQHDDSAVALLSCGRRQSWSPQDSDQPPWSVQLRLMQQQIGWKRQQQQQQQQQCRLALKAAAALVPMAVVRIVQAAQPVNSPARQGAVKASGRRDSSHRQAYKGNHRTLRSSRSLVLVLVMMLMLAMLPRSGC